MRSGHALLSASGAARWLACPPSARLEENLPRTSSSYADEGTAAHELCELTARYLLKDIPHDVFGKRLEDLAKGKYYTPDMYRHAMSYAEYVSETLDGARFICPDAFAELEVKGLDFSDYAPEGFGTGDCIIVADDTLEVIDFKYGASPKGAVEAKNNPQMRLYALGAIKRYGELYDIKTVRMTIIQSRVYSEPVFEEIPLTELIDWAENYVKPRAKLAFAGQGDFGPSEKACRFCRANERCKARADKNAALFDDAPETLLLTPDERGELLRKADDIAAWLTDLEKGVTRALLNGESVSGWKLVEGKSNRKITDAEKAAEQLKAAGYSEEQIYAKSLLGLGKLEDLTGKKELPNILKGLIVKPEGKPTLAPESDKRKAITPRESVLKAFDEGEEEEE